MHSDRPRQEGPGGRRVRRLRRIGRSALVVALLAASAAAVFHRPLFLGNVGEVEPGRVYRCAQPKGNLDDLIATYRPGSILNLRGGSYADPWYADEVQATDRLGIAFYDFPMKATRRPSRAELLTLIDLLDRCQYPLLVHCKSGADRTGLVSALYLLMHDGQPPERAIREFSLSYGHVPILGPERLHEPFEEYRDWLRAEGKAHDPAHFRSWVDRHYRDDQRPGAPEPIGPLRPGPRMGPPPSWLAEGRRAPRG